MFIKLTGTPSDKPFYVRPEEVKGIGCHGPSNSSIILINNAEYCVKETQEEIIKEMEKYCLG
jgi:uncharacterized protein YlzI (FlbEa/FlbD family)